MIAKSSSFGRETNRSLSSEATNCSMDFMRKPEAGVDLIAETRLLKLGKNLCVGDVLIYSEGNKKPVARASMTYSIPPDK